MKNTWIRYALYLKVFMPIQINTRLSYHLNEGILVEGNRPTYSGQVGGESFLVQMGHM